MSKIYELEKNTYNSEEKNEYSLLFKKKYYKVKFSFIYDLILFTIYPPKKTKKYNKYFYSYISKIKNLKKYSEILRLYIDKSALSFLIKELFVNNKIYLERNENIKKGLNLIMKLKILNKEEILVLPLEINNFTKNGYIVIENELTQKGNNIKNKYDFYSYQINYIENQFNSEFNNFNNEIKEIKLNNKYLNNKIISMTHQISDLKEKLKINNKIENKNKNQKSLKNREKKNIFNTSLKDNSSFEGINILKTIIKEKEEKNFEKLRNCFIVQSEIIKGGEEIDFILNRLDKYNPISYKLIYTSTLHGDKIQNFHKKCDGENFTLILIQTTKNYKFGGFTSIGFDSSGFELKDDNAFLFSINKKKIYDIILGRTAIYCNSRFGPIFCSNNSDNNYNICINDKYLTNISTTSNKSYNYEINDECGLNFGENTYIVNVLEIYKLILVNN